MGSLLPGWDERSPGVAPKEFQDIKEEDEESQGYFATYAKLKKLHAELGQPPSPIPIARRSASLTRRSLPQGAADGGQSSPRGSRDWTAFSPPGGLGGARSLSRAETMAQGGLRSTSSVAPAGSGGGGGAASGLQRMYSMPMTRGERGDVLAGLRAPRSPTSLSTGSPRTPSLDAYKTHLPDKAADYQWWRHFDSAAMNERPDEPVSKEVGYKPQYGVTGQAMAYHVEPPPKDGAKNGPAPIPAH